MQPYFNKAHQAGYDKIRPKLKLLKDRPGKIHFRRLHLGDLSENAEYSAAKRDLVPSGKSLTLFKKAA